MGMSTTSSPASWKHVLILSHTSFFVTTLRKCPSMLSVWMPTGSRVVCAPSLYSCVTASKMSRSDDCIWRFSSWIESMISSVIIVLSEKFFVILLGTVCMPIPPTPTYVWLIDFFSVSSSFFLILAMQVFIFMTLLMRPLRMNAADGSCVTARIWIPPSGCFLPAMPVTFEEPSSIATMKLLSVGIFYCFIVFCWG